jgi:hypothetical protein
MAEWSEDHMTVIGHLILNFGSVGRILQSGDRT